MGVIFFLVFQASGAKRPSRRWRTLNRKDQVSVDMIFESQYTLNQCKDKNYCLLGRGEDFHTGAMFKFTRSHSAVNAKKKRAVKRAVSLSKLMLVFSLLIFTSRFLTNRIPGSVEFNLHSRL